MSSNIKVQRICQHCGNEFTARTTVTKYCGDPCAKRAYKVRQRAAKIASSNRETSVVIARPMEELKARAYLSVTEVCRLLGISRRTVYRMMERGELRYGKAGRRTLIRRSDIDQLFEQPTNGN